MKNYTKSQLVTTDDLLYYGKPDTDIKELFDFAVSSGLTLRDDSPLVDWYMINNLDTWTVSHPQFFDPLYLQKPIVFELQHYHMVKNDGNWLGKNGENKIEKYGYSGADVLRKAIETMHATYIGYHGYAEDWLTDNPDLTNELANRCGYWYFPVKATFPSTLKKGENTCSITWENKGVAPGYTTYGLSFQFESLRDNTVFSVLVDDSGNTKWQPGKVATETYQLLLPEEAKKGKYMLKFKLVDNSTTETRDVHVGVSKKLLDTNNYTNLGEVIVK